MLDFIELKEDSRVELILSMVYKCSLLENGNISRCCLQAYNRSVSTAKKPWPH